ncbi:MAG: hypothetical protein ACHQ1D_08450 [Nitrososphaerales archaeon]
MTANLNIRKNSLIGIVFLLSYSWGISQPASPILIDTIIKQVKSVYSALEYYSDSATILTYNNENVLFHESVLEIQWKKEEAFDVCWSGHLSKFPLAFTIGCLHYDNNLTDSTTFCRNIGNRAIKTEITTLDSAILKFTGIAIGINPLLKVIFGNSLSSKDHLDNYSSNQISLDTLNDTIACFKLELLHLFDEHKIVDFESTNEIIGKGSVLLSLWVNCSTSIIQQYSLLTNNANNKKTLAKVILNPSQQYLVEFDCDNCCY